jgi:hypothetical protein
MIDMQANFLSTEEFSFKLTENFIPSFANSKGTLVPLESSLEYTHSLVSIQNMLNEEEEVQETIEKIEGSGFSKNGSLKASSVNTTTESSLKYTPRASFRERMVSNRQDSSRQGIQRRKSFHVFEFEQEKTTLRSSLIHATERKRSLSDRKTNHRSLIKRENNFMGNYSDVKTVRANTCKGTGDEISILFDLKKSMQIKQIKLRADEEREKNYMKRILQNRMCSIHLAEDISNSTPLWTSRKTFNRF